MNLKFLKRLVILAAALVSLGAVSGYVSDELHANTDAKRRAMYDDEQVACITEAIYYEGRSGLPGEQILQAMVILARAADSDPQWPKTPCGVIRQPGAFSYYYDEAVRLQPIEPRAWQRARKLARWTYEHAWTEQLLPRGGECMRNYRLSDKVLARMKPEHLKQLRVSKRSLKYFDGLKLVVTVGQHSFYALPDCRLKLPTT